MTADPPGGAFSPSQSAGQGKYSREILGRIGVGSTQPRHQPVRPILARSARLMRGEHSRNFYINRTLQLPIVWSAIREPLWSRMPFPPVIYFS